MPRFLTFDEKTASKLRQHVPEQQVFEHGAKNAVNYALGSEKTLVTVMPTGFAREAAVAVFRRPNVVAKPAPQPEQRGAAVPEMRKPAASVPVPIRDSALRAGGFLGLRDEMFFDQEPVVKKKQSWWRHFWPEDE